MQNVVIYLPNGQELYFELKAKLCDKDKNEVPFTVDKIMEVENKIIIHFSNGEIRTYANFPWSNLTK